MSLLEQMPSIIVDPQAGRPPLTTELQSHSGAASEWLGGQLANHPVVKYILQSWNTLTRSMSEDSSITDVKVAPNSILYFPADLPLTNEVAELYDRSHVQVRSLPRIIEQMGDVKIHDLPAPGLLYLPNPYVVPGGRFNEMYGWDSYFIVLGLICSGRFSLARGMVDNMLFEIRHYGAVLNANRTYFLTRTQPPFLTATILAVYECSQCFDPRESRLEWLQSAYRLAAKYYAALVQPHRSAGATGLARYFDMDSGPIPELADDSAYFEDVIEWLLAHPQQDPGFLVKAPACPGKTYSDHSSTAIHPGTGGRREPACVRGNSLTDDFYLGDRAMRESGFDSCFRFGPFCGRTHHYAPVCLNSLLFRYERDMATFAAKLDLAGEAQQWNDRADHRAAAIQKYLWRADEGLFQDYDFVRGQPSPYSYLSAYYPLWAGLATTQQAAALRQNLHQFERSGGLSMSTLATGMQWDEPFGWAPCNFIAAEGLRAYGYLAEARRISRAFITTVDINFASDATVREKYDVVRRDAEIQVTAGYKENVIGFGWTNAVYLLMQKLLLDNSDQK